MPKRARKMPQNNVSTAPQMPMEETSDDTKS